MGNVTTFEPYRGGLGDHRPVRRGFIAVKDQVALHKNTECLPEILDSLPMEFPRGWGSTRLNLTFELNHGSVTN